MRLRFKILILCLATTMTALLLQTWLFNRRSSALIYNQAKAENLSLLQNMQDDLFGIQKNIENNIISIYNHRQFMKDLNSERSIDVLRSQYYREAYNAALECFDSSDGVLALYIYDRDDQIISTYRRAVTPRHHYPVDIYDGTQDNNTAIVSDYVHGGDTTMLISSYYNQYRETDIIRFVMKLYHNSDTRQMIGYVVCDVDSKIFRYRIEKFVTDAEMFIWLQPIGDRPVLSIGQLNEADGQVYADIAGQLNTGSTDFNLSSGGSRRVFFQVDQNKYNISAYAQMPQSLLAANQKTLTVSLIIIAGVMVVITVVTSYLCSKSLTRPLEELTGTTERIKQGETHLRVQVANRDEIGELGTSFNEMLDQIERLISREYEIELLLNRAEYNALQAQINPHFLYNTLDTMSSIAQIRNCEEVSRLSQSLSNIFRYALDMKHPFSTVTKELVHLKNYIYVMTVRMQDNVFYDFDIDDEVLKDVVPRICLQPLVENALTHGLRNKKGEKKVIIRVKAEGEKLVIIVEDNGVGLADPDEINRRMEENDQDLVEGGKSIGLTNINARVRMLYGYAYGIRVESQRGEGARICLTVARKVTGEEAWNEKFTKY
ncbi:MAG: sensor histidine kinase [Lachnospiraceae bacterium]